MNELDIFSAALEMADPAARAHYLSDACSANPELRTRIEALLRNAAEASQFLESPAAARPGATGTLVDAAGNDPPTTPQPGLDRTEMSLDAESLNLDFLTPSDDPAVLGRIGQYSVTGVVGRGGMGIVLKASDESLNRVVAIKVLAPELSGNPTARKRFLREARAAAAIVHQHVVTIHAVAEDRLPYLVMEYVDGQSLQEKIDAAGPLELKETLRIGVQVAAGLAAAHAHGVIHRDIKPSNILLENGVERVRITDFGLARATDDVEITRPGEVAGTPQYMSPEQAQGVRVDARSDLFNLGCVLYAICTGRSPFRAETTVAAIHRVCEEAPRPIREVNPEAPEWLTQIIDRLLAKRADDRIQTAQEVAQLLGQQLAHVQHPGSTPFPAAVCVHKPGPGAPGPGLSRRWAAVAMLLLAAMAALGATEATGVTHLAGTVVRIVTGEGTLIIEVDDPTVQVALDGEELTISRAGVEQLKLRPGQYKFTATTDGRLVKQELVTITRGGERLVTVSREALDRTTVAVESELVRVFAGAPTSHVDFVALSPDGRRVVSTGEVAGQPVCMVWDVATGQQQSLLQGHTNSIQCVALAPDSRRALTASLDRTVRLWNVETGQELHRFDTPGHSPSVAWSPDGNLALIGTFEGTVILWDVANESELRRLDHGTGLWSVAYCPVRPLALTAGSERQGAVYVGVIRLWDLDTGMEVRRFEGPPTGVWCAVFSPDGLRVLSAEADATVRLWDVKSGREIRPFRGHSGQVFAVAFTADGRWALSGGGDQTVRLWDVDTGAELRCFRGHTNMVRSVAADLDGKYALSGGFDGTARLWRLPPTEPIPATKEEE